MPSRGFIFTKVLESLEKNLRDYRHKKYFSYDLKIPDCFNYLTEQALKDKCDFLLYVEEDVVLPDKIVSKMLLLDKDIVAVDYAVNSWSCVTRDEKTDEILWTGLGGTLVKNIVFDKLEKPYFRSDKLLLLNDWPNISWINAGSQSYGGQDIYFFLKAREAGFSITQIEGECEHLKLESLGRKEVNNGFHQIGNKGRIEKRQTL